MDGVAEMGTAHVGLGVGLVRRIVPDVLDLVTAPGERVLEPCGVAVVPGEAERERFAGEDVVPVDDADRPCDVESVDPEEELQANVGDGCVESATQNGDRVGCVRVERCTRSNEGFKDRRR